MPRRGGNQGGRSHTHILWPRHLTWLKAVAEREGRTESDILRRLIDEAIERETPPATPQTYYPLDANGPAMEG